MDVLGVDQARVWQLRCTLDLVALRKVQLALRDYNQHPFCTDDYSRVLAFDRWLEGSSDYVLIVAALAETTLMAARSAPLLQTLEGNVTATSVVRGSIRG